MTEPRSSRNEAAAKETQASRAQPRGPDLEAGVEKTPGEVSQTQRMTPLFRTASGALYAQDASGRIYRDDALQFSGPLIAIDTPQTPDGKLAVGCRAFLLIDNGTQFGWRITTAIVELFREPTLPTLPTGWRWDSRQLLSELMRDRDQHAPGPANQLDPREEQEQK